MLKRVDWVLAVLTDWVCMAFITVAVASVVESSCEKYPDLYWGLALGGMIAVVNVFLWRWGTPRQLEASDGGSNA